MKDKRPEWIKVRLKGEHQLREVKEMLSRLSLHTVCEEANCPNIGECFGRRTATFMILGRVCTRNCTFCNVTKGNAQPVDPNEPRHVAEAVKELQLRHVVITSVTRDDLPDGGAAHFAEVIKSIKALDEKVVVEVLIPDFKSSQDALKLVVDAKPEIINHNVETVPRLYPTVRPMAVYQRSLSLFKNVKTMDDSILTKSGIMLGLGEREEEVIDVLKDLRKVRCDIITTGQYLAPSKKHHPVVVYIRPEVFDRYKDICLELGFKYVASSPLVRSSYHADQALK